MASDDLRDQLRPEFPFGAVVGCERARKALVCALASPDISSVLICGPRGTGKSVLARSLSGVAGGRRIVTLPLNATEDRVFGGMDMERTIRDGRRVSSGSILSRADGNILLVDDINLLPEHIVFQIMNAAETRSNTVERDGISEVQGCSFLLVATMNPDEGGLPDHVLDRFDMCVFTSNADEEGPRREAALRRLAFEADPVGFSEGYLDVDAATADAIARARARVRFTRVPDGYCGAISEVCSQLNVSGHRGDISVMNAACALAALDDRDSADLDDLREAAAMCLEHRRNDPPDPDQPSPEEPPDTGDAPDGGSDGQSDPPDGDDRDPDRPDAPIPPPPEQETHEEVFFIGDVFRVVDYMRDDDRLRSRGRAGRRSASLSDDRTGRCIGYTVPKGRISDVALVASIRAAAPYQVLRDHSELAVVLRREDLREKVRERRQGNSILFLVDGSGSIGAQKRMIAVKGAILSMLRDAYQKRDSIGMAVFRTDRAEEILPLTRSILQAYKVLAEIPTGGRTPLTHGLIRGHELLKEHISKGSRPVMVILSDGRCNVSYTPGSRPVDEMLSTARAMAGCGIRFIVIDTESGRLRFGLAMDLCRALDGTYLRLEDLNAEYIERSVRMAMDA